MASLFVFSLTVIFNCLILVFGIEDYCSVNQIPSDGTRMQFSKEVSTSEFAIKGKFKGLHCCAKGYRSIEWHKDGKPYPWQGTVSQLIIYPESANQTVYTQSVNPEDAGNYTCIMTNDLSILAHTIQLRVFDKVPTDPKITYISQKTHGSVGQYVRLFCEAFVGRVDLPDAYNEAVWSKVGENGTIQNEPRIRQEKISREDGQTFGTYLIIEKLENEDYGEYTCTISKPGKTIELSTLIYEAQNTLYINPNPVPYKKILIWAAIIVVVIVTVLILNLQYGLLLRVYIKDRFGRLQENDSKVNDVLILYNMKDAEIVLGVLVPTLEAKYNYTCATRQLIDNINIWYKDLEVTAHKSRRIVAVISPSCFHDKWESNILYQALKQLYELDSHFCCITFKEFPTSGDQIKNSQGETLLSIVRNINVIHWERSKDDRFWLSLRLRLPPKRNCVTKLDNVNDKQNEKSTRLNSNSQESLDNLV